MTQTAGLTREGRIARVLSGTLVGLRGHRVRVEVDVAPGLPGFSLVGLPSASLRESRERIGASLRHAGFAWPEGRITVNLAPADLRKDGASMDLAIATGILLASGQIPRPAAEVLRTTLLIGEVTLDGALRPTRGAWALGLDAAHLGARRMLMPAPSGSASLAGWLPTDVVEIAHLRELRAVATRLRESVPAEAPSPTPPPPGDLSRALAGIRGQVRARRALVLAAWGRHHLFLQGPPGCGKTLLARSLARLLPPLTSEEAREQLRIRSCVGEELAAGSAFRPPFRAPHHTVSVAGLVGGGRPPRPGEITRAHRGVLFLDEIAEFGAARLDRLREALETGEIRHARLGQNHAFPARFQLVAAQNPCPCGWHGSALDRCRCAPHEIRRYRARLSGPLRDRIDLWVEMDREPAELMWSSPGPEEDLQRLARLLREGGWSERANARLQGEELLRRCDLDPPARELARRQADALGLGLRGLHSVLRVARSIADLDDAPSVRRRHLAEAFAYRPPP